MPLYTVNEIYDKYFENAFKVFDIFKDFFGEENVDICGIPEKSLITTDKIVRSMGILRKNGSYDIPDTSVGYLTDYQVYSIYILVYWPEVVVSNEQGESITIWDLYSKINITQEGTIVDGISFNRARYNSTQFYSNYMHSHVLGIDTNNLSEFKNVCLGSSPITHTINTLKGSFDSVLWLLFCEELNRLVSVESLEGVPYRRLSGVHSEANYQSIDFIGDVNLNKVLYDLKAGEMFDFIKEFTVHYIKYGKYNISYSGEMYTVSNSLKSVLLDMSNLFIEFYNKAVMDGSTIIKKDVLRLMNYAVVVNDTLKLVSNIPTQTNETSDESPLFVFKGEPVYLKIDIDLDTNGFLLIINPTLAFTILNQLLNIINFKYESTSRNSEDVYFI